MKKIGLLLSLCLSAAAVMAQQSLTLEDCLRYAQDNNLTIKQAYLNLDLSKKVVYLCDLF